MDPIQRQILLEQRKFLHSNMERALKDEEFISELELQGIVSSSDKYDLKSGSFPKKFAYLMDLLPTRGPNAFDRFCVALACHQYCYLAARLKAREVHLTESMPNKNSNKTAKTILQDNFFNHCAAQMEKKREDYKKTLEDEVHTIANSLQRACQQEGYDDNALKSAEVDIETLAKSVLGSSMNCFNCMNTNYAMDFIAEGILEMKARTDVSGDPREEIPCILQKSNKGLEKTHWSKIQTLFDALNDMLFKLKLRTSHRHRVKSSSSKTNELPPTLSKPPPEARTPRSSSSTRTKSNKFRPGAEDKSPKTDKQTVTYQPKRAPIVTESHVLSDEEKNIVQNGKFNSAIMNKCISIIQNSFSEANGIQPCSQQYFDPRTGEDFIQILLVQEPEQHERYVVITNMGSSEDTVKIYDSSGKTILPSQSVVHLTQIRCPPTGPLKLEFVRCPHQQNGDVSGLHAVANAVAILAGYNPLYISAYKSVEKLTHHILECFKVGQLSQFPQSPGRPKSSKSIKPQIVNICCTCRRPKLNDDEHFQCHNCKEYFHPECQGIKMSAKDLSKGNIIPKCKKCSQ